MKHRWNVWIQYLKHPPTNDHGSQCLQNPNRNPRQSHSRTPYYRFLYPALYIYIYIYIYIHTLTDLKSSSSWVSKFIYYQNNVILTMLAYIYIYIYIYIWKKMSSPINFSNSWPESSDHNHYIWKKSWSPILRKWNIERWNRKTITQKIKNNN
jgi:hypothetical protein